MELTKAQLVGILQETIDKAVDPLHREIDLLSTQIRRLDQELAQLRYDLAKLRAMTRPPEMERLSVL